MQHSADFTSLHAHRADAARGERELEFRRIAEERRALDAEQEPAASVSRRRRPHRLARAARLAVR